MLRKVVIKHKLNGVAISLKKEPTPGSRIVKSGAKWRTNRENEEKGGEVLSPSLPIPNPLLFFFLFTFL